MNIPFLDLKANYNSIKSEVNAAIQQVLDNTAYILGASVQNFERDFSAAHQVKYCLGTSSGTDANHLVLWGLGIGAGDEVIVPANTFIATAWGATLCGATPVFVDCDPETYNIDPAKVEKAITKKTKAIVAVHLYGQSADLDPLIDIAKKHNLILVEDAAQAHLAEYKGKLVGGLTEAASFSYYPGKNLGAYGEGGAVTTNNEALYNKIKKLREHGQSQKYYHDILGHNYRMEGIQGAVLEVKLKYLSKWTDARRSVAAKYNEGLKNFAKVITPKEASYAKHVYHLYVIQLNDGSLEKSNQLRDKLKDFLTQNGVNVGLHYPIPLHMQECFKNLGYKKGDFPNSEKIAEAGLSLPMFPELTDEQINYVIEKIKEFFSK
ncbi:MAG: DegT/DnrJ/EryC1/StrS family aminotransferase [Ignavibacteriota bacterium]|nr:DegT/DnrJ/EryC1/StrS family aminotransferase [Ignavibacteriota bacterium]MBW7842457.1 DegT/DnrJ/EryC1/StrS family aminotransferase [Ignavibacterium sp.]MCZ2270184.1 DegT/DnrJ/EryC1/StrS family aminotransferase [Ignavibacteriales bacterium]HMN18780.1 DegT/DnrJ/EryC1/StrS family aminotransferase [Ignavibacteriaceae bacterium]QKJ98231.1 MAG: DegT/DnrJ/EryC1/StrS family aminotransferase [Ignavibacteriota bacterium]